jgi:hemolysin activation/secretion protein
MRALSLALLVTCVSAALPAAAQVPPVQTPPSQLPNAIQPGRATNPNLRGPDVPEAQLQFSFPAQRKTEQARSSDELRFTLKRVVVEGASVVGADFWDPLIAPLLTRPVALPELVTVAEAIQARYVALGYALTRAFVPPQDMQDGTLTIKVVEGYIGKVRVEGAPPDTAKRLERLAAATQKNRPVNNDAIERVLLLAEDLPGMKVTGVLKPGEDPGAADLMLTAEQKSWAVAAGGSNRATRFTGPWTAFADVAANDLLGWGEQVGATVSGAPKGLEQVTADFRWLQPLGDGLMLTTTLDYGRGKPGAGLQAFALKTTSASVGQRLSYPVIRSRRENLAIEAGWTMQRSRINLLGSQFSSDEWRTVDLRVSYSEAGFLKGGTLLSAGIIRGLNVFGATDQRSTSSSRLNADPNFTKFVAEAQRLQPLGAGFLLVLSASGQYSARTLFAGEEFSLGGGRFGRGYNPSDLSGGNGFGSSAELRRTFEFDSTYVQSVSPYLFFDWGRVWKSATADTFLRSAGAGVKLDFGSGKSLGLELAQPLRNLPVTGAQDPSTRFFVDLGLAF